MKYHNPSSEQVSDFRYLGCDASFKKNKDLDNKMHKFLHIFRSLSRIFKNKSWKETKLKFYKHIQLNILTCSSSSFLQKVLIIHFFQAPLLGKTNKCSRVKSTLLPPSLKKFAHWCYYTIFPWAFSYLPTCTINSDVKTWEHLLWYKYNKR